MSALTRRRWIAGGLFLAIAVASVLSGALISQFFDDSDRQFAAATDRPAQAPMPSGFAGQFEAGLSALRDGRAHAAAQAFEAARQVDPHVPEVYVNLGFAYLEMGQAAAGKAAFEEALKLRPTQANAYYGLAECYEALQDLELAIGAMRSYAHLADREAPFQRRAQAAIWEWEAAVNQRRQRALAKEAEGARVETAKEILAAFSGRYVLLNIWATWCAPCREELPSLQRLADRVDKESVEVAALSLDQDADFAAEYLRELGIRFPSFFAQETESVRQSLEVGALPLTILYSPTGQPLHRIVGIRDWDDPTALSGLLPK